MASRDRPFSGETPSAATRQFVVATITVGLAGFAVSKALESEVQRPRRSIVGASLLVTTIAILSTRFASAGATTSPGWIAAVVVGAGAEGCAFVPGLSRSGLTIASLLWMV